MKKSSTIAMAGGLFVALTSVVGWWVYQRSFAPMQEEQDIFFIENAPQDTPKYGIEYTGIPDTPKVLTNAVSYNGTSVEVACTTCHTTRTSNIKNNSGDDFELFHQGINFQHGKLSCLSCHNSEDYDSLRLADGSSLHYKQTMQLCAQCHGPQYRDYQRGSHGGMNGHWDLTRGGRTRNACNVCHDPHAPAYPQLIPVFAPKDIPKTKNNDESDTKDSKHD